jgi:hypothetical protein
MTGHSMELPLAAWLKTLLDNVNVAEHDDDTANRLRLRLQQLIDGKLPLRGHFKRLLPPLFVSLRGSRLNVTPEFSPRDVEEAQGEGWSLLEEYGEALEGVIYALSGDPLGSRLRRCDYCRIFFVMKRNHRRIHHFCCEEHRRAYEHAHRDRDAQAAYMRRWRRLSAERKARHKR